MVVPLVKAAAAVMKMDGERSIIPPHPPLPPLSPHLPCMIIPLAST